MCQQIHTFTTPERVEDPGWCCTDIKYQPQLKAFVCVCCKEVVKVPFSHYYNKHPDAVHPPGYKDAINRVSQTYDVSASPHENIPSHGLITAIPWLASPFTGFGCPFCNYGCASSSSVATHLKSHSTLYNKEDGPVSSLVVGACHLQKLTLGGVGSKAFQVHPILDSENSASKFSSFFVGLSSLWRTGDILKSSINSAAVSEESDFTNFIGRAGWAAATSGYDMKALRQTVALPSTTTCQNINKLSGLGYLLLSKHKNLNHVHPNIPQLLTSWRKIRCV